MAGRTGEAGGPNGGHETRSEARPAGETGESGKRAEEARAVPGARAAGVETGTTTGDARRVGLAARALRALTSLPRAGGRGLMALFGRSDVAASALRPGVPPGGDSRDVLAAAVRAIEEPVANSRSFFDSLPHHTNRISGPGEMISRVRGGEVYYVGEGGPVLADQMYAYGADVGARPLVAGMIEPNLGFVVNARTGQGYFIIHNFAAEMGPGGLKAGGTTLFEEINPGVNYPSPLHKNALIVVPTSEGLKLYHHTPATAVPLVSDGYLPNHANFVGDAKDLPGLHEKSIHLNGAFLRVNYRVPPPFDPKATIFGIQNELAISMTSQAGGPAIVINGYELGKGQRINFDVVDGVHHIQVGRQGYYLIADQSSSLSREPGLLMILPVEATTGADTRSASDIPVSSAGANWTENRGVGVNEFSALFANLAPGIYTTTGYPMRVKVTYAAHGAFESGPLVSKRIDFDAESTYPAITLNDLVRVRGEIAANGDRPDREVPPSRRVDLAATMFGMPTDFVVLPEVAGVPKIPFGEEIQVDSLPRNERERDHGYGRRLVYDFTGDGNVILDVLYHANGIRNVLFGSPTTVRATFYAAAGQTVVIGSARTVIGGAASGKFEFDIPTEGSGDFPIQVNGTPYHITFTQRDGHTYALVTSGE
ncbi:MAG: hypothetical protein HYU97_00055 [Deltaproteobacteria bacterium]|nr:hypothetical protein [Deltaproteobacteria bacterium]